MAFCSFSASLMFCGFSLLVLLESPDCGSQLVGFLFVLCAFLLLTGLVLLLRVFTNA